MWWMKCLQLRLACLLITRYVKVPPPRSPAADKPLWAMTVGLSLNYTDSIWQGILSHLKRLLPMKSQVCSSCCSTPTDRSWFETAPRHVIFFFPLLFFSFLPARYKASARARPTLPFFKVFPFHLLEGPAGIRLSKLLPQSQQAAFHVRQESHQALGFT